MNKKTIAATILGLALAGSALGAESAATNTTTANASVWQKLKESPASLNILSATDATKNSDHKINGVSMTNIVYLGWKLSEKDSLRLENRWSTSKKWQAATKEEREMDTTMSRQVIKYSRSGILNQKDHGVNVKAALEGRYYPDHDMRVSKNSYGLVRPSVSVSRSFESGLSLSNTLYYAKNLNIKTKEHGTTVDYLYLVLSQSYSFTDKLSLSLTEEFFHAYKKGRKYLKADSNGKAIRDIENVSISMELGYQFNPSIYGGVSVASSPFVAHDQRTTAVDWAKDLGYGFNVYMSAF
ncbi:MAG: hypothetical protein HN576_08470 [Bacteriovoracaceae bacterium]|jgi:hypothetical protein|nr:hypothetical protein [Bacteriovoracaceae bacterium]